MSLSGKEPASLAHFVRKLRGGSQPILAVANDDHLYFIKFTNNLQGPNLSFNESMGSELYRLSNLPGPCWRPILVTGSFLDENQDCWMETEKGRLRPQEGLCFGSRFLCEEKTRLFEILPGASYKRVRNLDDFWLAWLLDICASHADNRQAIFTQNTSGLLDAIFIDHGHMYGGPAGKNRLHFKASRYLDRRVYSRVSSNLVSTLRRSAARVDADRLWANARILPDDWKTASAFKRLAETLETLSKPRLIEGVIETVMDSYRREDGIASIDSEYQRPPTVSVLRPAIQSAELRRLVIH